jgi:GH25 family lysozyme M1 (1,4-beta-N-acetylmuramidase)
MTLSGIDISHHNYTVLKSDGLWKLHDRAALGFVIMKASEGVSFSDPRFNEYIRAIGEADIMTNYVQVGAYHYARPENNSAIAEAHHFVDIVGRYAGHMVYALDVEGRALEFPNVGKWSLEWLQTVYSLTGVKPLIYCQRSALSRFKEAAAADFGLWLASWTKAKPQKCEPWRFMAIWQNNGMNLDTDYFFGSPDQWRKYAAAAGRK